MNDDEKFKAMLQAINKTFWHQTVTTEQIEQFIIDFSGLKLETVFHQYLRTVDVPIFEYEIIGDVLKYHWVNCKKDFEMSVRLNNGLWVECTTSYRQLSYSGSMEDFLPSTNFYVRTRKL